MGQKYLADGKAVSMRLWDGEEPSEPKPEAAREYETVGYVIKGRAELHLEGQVVRLEPGNSWVVSKAGEISEDRKSTRLNSSHANISYAVFCLKKNKSAC